MRRSGPAKVGDPAASDTQAQQALAQALAPVPPRQPRARAGRADLASQMEIEAEEAGGSASGAEAEVRRVGG